MTTPWTPAFRTLVAEYGYELGGRVGAYPSQYAETVVRRHLFGPTLVDMVSLTYSVDRGDVERTGVLIGWGENRRFTLSDLVRALGAVPTGTGDDFLLAARLIDVAAVERLAPGASRRP